MEKLKIYTEETLVNEVLEQPVDVDFLLPDYLPDVVRVLKCVTTPRISSRRINDTSIVIDGSVDLNVLYKDDRGKINSFLYQYSFEKIKDTNIDVSNGTLSAYAKVEYMNIRAVTNRKIDIHGAVGINVSVTENKSSEIIVDANDETVKTLKSSMVYSHQLCFGEKPLNIEEETEVAFSNPVYSLLRYDGTVTVKETKALSGKAIVKGELIVNSVFLGEDGETQKSKVQIPFSQIVEIECNDADCTYESGAEIGFIDIKPKTDSRGAISSVSIVSKVIAFVKCVKEENKTVVVDAYSRKYKSEISRKNVRLSKRVKTINETFSVKKSITFEDANISAVLDDFCKVQINEVKNTGNKLSVLGILAVSFITEDEDKNVSFYEKQLDFEYNNAIEVECAKIKCMPKIYVVSCDYTISSVNTLELRAELCVSATIYECTQNDFITEINIDKENPNDKSRTSAMTIYFASIGEKIWDIARKYFASSKEIKEINQIETEELQNDTMILVPLD